MSSAVTPAAAVPMPSSDLESALDVLKVTFEPLAILLSLLLLYSLAHAIYNSCFAGCGGGGTEGLESGTRDRIDDGLSEHDRFVIELATIQRLIERAENRLASQMEKVVVVYGDGGVSEKDGKSPEKFDGKECAICLMEFNAGERCRILPHCGHGFHETCVDRWFENSLSCPMCRDPI